MPFSVDDEGLHSRKAIAFINSKGNKRLTKCYSEPCMKPQSKVMFSAITFKSTLAERLEVLVKSEFGEMLWKK